MSKITYIPIYKYEGQFLQVKQVPVDHLRDYLSEGWYSTEELAKDNAE